MIAPEMPSEPGITSTSRIDIVPVQEAFSLFTRRSPTTDRPRIQAKVQPTTVQKAVGGLSSVVNYPSRRTAEWINATAEAVARTRSRVGTVAEAAVDSLTAGRDAALLQAEQIATRNGARSTETALHRTRVLASGLCKSPDDALLRCCHLWVRT